MPSVSRVVPPGRVHVLWLLASEGEARNTKRSQMPGVTEAIQVKNQVLPEESLYKNQDWKRMAQVLRFPENESNCCRSNEERKLGATH